LSGHQSQQFLKGLIVLGARLNAEGRPGRVAKMRLLYALSLWQEHGAQGYLILTGGQRPGTVISEAQSMAAYALDWAKENGGASLQYLLEQSLILEEASLNTTASARHTLPLVQALKLPLVGLVSDALHIYRAHYIFKRHFSPHGIRLYPLAAPGVLKSYWQQGRYLRLGKMALREGGAWGKALGEAITRKLRR